MTDKPIIFRADMIRGLLDGRKTQTRRVLKDQPRPNEPIGGASHYRYGDWVWQHGMDGSIVRRLEQWPGYTVGDRLWVRERFSPHPMEAPPSAPRKTRWNIFYDADGKQNEVLASADYNPTLFSGENLKPSIHMPRWASRLTLEVTDVRVERVQDISEADARAEGVGGVEWGDWRDYGGLALYRPSFAELWDSIHGDDPVKGWDANPWVVAVTFDVHRCNIDQMES